MKSCFLFFFLLFQVLFFKITAQTIRLIPNPDTSKGLVGDITTFGNKLLSHYFNAATGKVQFVACDANNNLTLIQNPDSGSLVKWESYKNRWFYNIDDFRNIHITKNRAYSLYKTQNGKLALLSFDGIKTDVINIPNGYSLDTFLFNNTTTTQISKSLFGICINDTNKRLAIFEYNDSNGILIYDFLNGKFPDLFFYKDSLYFFTAKEFKNSTVTYFKKILSKFNYSDPSLSLQIAMTNDFWYIATYGKFYFNDKFYFMLIHNY